MAHLIDRYCDDCGEVNSIGACSNCDEMICQDCFEQFHINDSCEEEEDEDAGTGLPPT